MCQIWKPVQVFLFSMSTVYYYETFKEPGDTGHMTAYLAVSHLVIQLLFQLL